MKSIKLSIAATAAAAVCAAAFSAAPASADPTPLGNDIVGVGSDTAQLALNAVADGYSKSGVVKAGYNATALNRLVSFDATNPLTGASASSTPPDYIVPRLGATKILRPDGSGSGKKLLYGTTNNSSINFARSSSALSSAEVAGNLTAYPYALDTVTVAVKGGSSYAPAALSIAQLYKIYTGVYTNWNQVGGADAPIQALLPQTLSGTGQYFVNQLIAYNSAYSTGPSVITGVQEQDPTVFNTYPTGVVVFSVGRISVENTKAGSTVVQGENNGTPSDGGSAFASNRDIYNVVRTTDASSSWVSNLFSSTGYFCSPAAKGAITAGGLTQLATSDNGGVCGQPITTTTPATNYTTS